MGHGPAPGERRTLRRQTGHDLRGKAVVRNRHRLPGIRAQPSHGHTAGHTTYLVESDGQKFVIWGDLLHAAALQFADPGVAIQFDTDQKAAIAERKKADADAAKNGYLVGITHVSFPGVGHVRTAPGGKGYEWLPINYTSNK